MGFVEEQQAYEMANVDKVQALLQMCPATLRARLLEEQGKGLYQSYEDLLEEVMFRAVDILDNGGLKKIGAVGTGKTTGDRRKEAMRKAQKTGARTGGLRKEMRTQHWRPSVRRMSKARQEVRAKARARAKVARVKPPEQRQERRRLLQPRLPPLPLQRRGQEEFPRAA